MLSIVIPVYNEEGIIKEGVEELVAKLQDQGFDRFEILLCENGSTDRTVELIDQMAAVDGRVKLLQIAEPNYGKALRLGILNASYEVIACLEIDYRNIDFLRAALPYIDSGATIVVGSKNLRQSRDKRPWSRRLFSRGFHLALKVLMDFKGTDTHGIKVLRAAAAKVIAGRCKLEMDLFATEFVLRAEAANEHIVELPIELEETRPTPIRPLKRIRKTLHQLFELFWILRINRK